MNKTKLVEIHIKSWLLPTNAFFTDDAKFNRKCHGCEIMSEIGS